MRAASCDILKHIKTRSVHAPRYTRVNRWPGCSPADRDFDIQLLVLGAEINGASGGSPSPVARHPDPLEPIPLPEARNPRACRERCHCNEGRIEDHRRAEAWNNDLPPKEGAFDEKAATEKESIVEKGAPMADEHPDAPGVKSSMKPVSPT